MRKKYVVDLTETERQTLRSLTKKGQTRSRRIRRAHILLLADQDHTDATIAQMLSVGQATVERTRKRFVEAGFEAALSESPRPGKAAKLDGKGEAYLTALACSTPPQGRTRWTMQLLANRLVEVGQVESISDETVRRVLKKTT